LQLFPCATQNGAKVKRTAHQPPADSENPADNPTERGRKLILANPALFSPAFLALLAILAGHLFREHPAWAAVFGATGLGLTLILFNTQAKRFTATAALCFLALVSWRGSTPAPRTLPLGTLLTFKGKITRDPRQGDVGPSLIAEIEAAASAPGENWSPLQGKVYVRVIGAPEPFPGRGDIVLFRAKLKAPKGLLNPSSSGFAEFLAAKGVTAKAAVKWPGEIAFVAPGFGASPLLRWRRRMSSLIATAAPGRSGQVLRALTLCDRSGLARETYESFRAAGTAHILAISGLHLGFLALILRPFFRFFLVRIPGLALRRPVDSLAPILTIPVLIVFAALSGFQTSTMRALVMVCLMIAGVNWSRAASPVALLCSTAALMALANPNVLSEQGFQLSVAALAGLFWLAPLIETRLVRPAKDEDVGAALLEKSLPRKVADAFVKWWIKGFSASIAATLATLPVVVFYFGSASAAGFVANPVVVPLMVFICLPFGLLGIGTYALWPGAAKFMWLVSTLGIEAIIRFQNFAVGFTAGFAPELDWTMFQFPTAVIGSAILLVWFGLFLKGKKSAYVMPLMLVCGIVMLFIAPAAKLYSLKTNSDAQLWVLDVGQAQALALQLPYGEWAIIDGGGGFDDGSGNAFDMGEKTVIPALKALGADRLTLAVSTHPHPDHLSGLVSTVKWGRPKTLWLPQSFRGDKRYADLLDVASAVGSRIVWVSGHVNGHVSGHVRGRGSKLKSEPETELEVDGVRIAALQGSGPVENDRSLAIRISQNNRAILLPADLEVAGQRSLLASGFPLDCDVLVAPHHGAKSALYAPFLEAASPETVLISAGGRHGLPSGEFVRAARETGAKVYSTHEAGILHVILGEQGAVVETPLAPRALEQAGGTE